MTLPRRMFALLLVALPLVPAFGKDPPQPDDLFDFWVGDWNARWKKPDGTEGRGRNTISKVLDGKVLEENFVGEGTDKTPGLKGRSLSVKEAASGVWKQTWTDNQGGFIVLSAQADGDRKMFVTEGKESFKRMVFHNIKKDSFTWDWESTTDGGKTWKLQWRIEYERRPEENKPVK